MEELLLLKQIELLQKILEKLESQEQEFAALALRIKALEVDVYLLRKQVNTK